MNKIVEIKIRKAKECLLDNKPIVAYIWLTEALDLIRGLIGEEATK